MGEYLPPEKHEPGPVRLVGCRLGGFELIIFSDAYILFTKSSRASTLGQAKTQRRLAKKVAKMQRLQVCGTRDPFNSKAEL